MTYPIIIKIFEIVSEHLGCHVPEDYRITCLELCKGYYILFKNKHSMLVTEHSLLLLNTSIPYILHAYHQLTTLLFI